MLTSTSDGATTIYYEYDALGRLTKETNDNIIKVYSYDADGNRTSMSITKDGIEEMAANYTYDNRGRVTSVNFGENMFAAAEYEYYSDNKLKKETRYGVVTEYEYNAAGLNTLTKTTYNGVIMDCNMLTYDLAGNAIIRDVSGAPNIAAGIMLYTYDKLGQMLTERCDYGGVYGFSNTYAYDTRGNRTEVRRTGEYTGNTASAYGYDNNNRLKEEYRYDYTIDKHYFRMYTYDKNGNVVRIDDLSAYGYEEVLTKQYRIYSYDDFGRLKYIQTEAMSEEALPGYTPATELETQAMSLNADFNAIDYRQFAYEESEEERLMREQAIERAMEVWRMRNGITEEETEEVIGEEPVELISKTSEEISSEEITENNSAETMEETEISEEVFESEVSIDETEETTTEEVVAENLIELEIPETEIVSEEISEENTYELQKEVLVEDTVETEEMVSEEISEELILEAETEEILVEETENELAEESVAVVDKLTEVSLTDESTSELTFPITTYIINYTYNPDGTRASKSVDLFADVEITEHIWDNGYIVMDYNMETQYEIEPESGELLKYYRGIHLIVNDINYVIYDDMGNIVGEVGMADVPGKVTEYDAFGNAYVSTQSPFGYRGEYTDYETGYVYLRNRYYNPETGRFITEDPIRDGLNWYVYCGNNPVNYTDPTGLFRIVDGESYDRYEFGSGNVYNIVDDYEAKDIEKMQKRLQELGYLDPSIDAYGYFGKQTLAAINEFKEDNGIQNNTIGTKGIVGATTWAYLGLDFDVIESSDLTITNVTMSKGVLRVDRNITNANISTTYSVAKAIKAAYKVAFGEEFNVSTDSVYWELAGHLFADSVAEQNKNGLLNPLWSRIQKSTVQIDIGDNIIVPDNNRWIWDLMAKYSE